MGRIMSKYNPSKKPVKTKRPPKGAFQKTVDAYTKRLNQHTGRKK